jgi:hypothetical protein
VKILAISGHAQNGKDTVAELIKNSLKADGNRVLVAHYADLLKYMCRTFFDWDGNKDEKGRHILQYVGTDIIRKQAPDFWVDFISSVLMYFKENWDYVLIPDTRFPNEINKLLSNGFDVTHIRVVRPNFESSLTEEQQKHPSETALDNVNPDFYIYNEGSIEELQSKINEWIKSNLYRG